MSRYIDIEPYEKDGWYLQKRYHNSYGEVIKTTPLVSVPTAEAEPVEHGRWIPVTNSSGGFECSVCTNYAPSYRDGVEWHSRFCPTCGAKMDLDEVNNA